MKRLSILILLALSVSAHAGRRGDVGSGYPTITPRHGFNVVTVPTGLPGGGNDVLPQVIKRPVNGGCTNGCSPTKPTGGVR